MFWNCSCEINFRAPSRHKKGRLITIKIFHNDFLLFFYTAKNKTVNKQSSQFQGSTQISTLRLWHDLGISTVIPQATIIFWNLRCGNYSREETIHFSLLIIQIYIFAACYQTFFWPFTVGINSSSYLKNFANSQPSASNFKFFSITITFFSHSGSKQFW